MMCKIWTYPRDVTLSDASYCTNNVYRTAAIHALKLLQKTLIPVVSSEKEIVQSHLRDVQPALLQKTPPFSGSLELAVL